MFVYVYYIWLIHSPADGNLGHSCLNCDQYDDTHRRHTDFNSLGQILRTLTAEPYGNLIF